MTSSSFGLVPDKLRFHFLSAIGLETIPGQGKHTGDPDRLAAWHYFCLLQVSIID